MAIRKNAGTRKPSTASDPSQRDQTDALLRDLGAGENVIEAVSSRIDDDDVQGVVAKLRRFAEENPRIVLGALSALIAGGAVVAGRAVVKSRAKDATDRKPAASKAAGKPAKARGTSKAGSKSGKAGTASKTGSKSAKAGATSKRTLIEPHPGDKRYVRRDAKGRIKESVDVGRSLAADQRRTSKTRSKSGSGDKGDR